MTRCLASNHLDTVRCASNRNEVNVAMATRAARARTSDGRGSGCLFKELGKSGLRSVAGVSISQFGAMGLSPGRDEERVFVDP